MFNTTPYGPYVTTNPHPLVPFCASVEGFTFPPTKPSSVGDLCVVSPLVVNDPNDAAAMRAARLLRFSDALSPPPAITPSDSVMDLSPPSEGEGGRRLSFEDETVSSSAGPSVSSIAGEVISALAPMLREMVAKALQDSLGDDSPPSKRQKRV
jgi:hypothetical protein